MSEFLDELARAMATSMPRSRAMRLLAGAFVSAAVSSASPRFAWSAQKRPLDECDHPLRCVGKKTCGIPHPNAGPSPIPVCGVVCCTPDLPVCCKWPEVDVRRVAAGKLNGGCQTAVGVACCCPPGAKCGDIAAGKFACESQVCGPDITGAFEDAIARTKAAFANWSATRRAVACDTLVQTPVGLIGWEINQLGPGGRDEVAERYQPECATCGGSLSVQVQDGCHYSGSVNYVIYGVMLRLCHDHFKSSLFKGEAFWFTEDQMVHNITVYKTLRRAPNLTASLNWARAGYHDWPGVPTPPPELPTCAQCAKGYTGRMTVRWLPVALGI